MQCLMISAFSGCRDRAGPAGTTRAWDVVPDRVYLTVSVDELVEPASGLRRRTDELPGAGTAGTVVLDGVASTVVLVGGAGVRVGGSAGVGGTVGVVVSAGGVSVGVKIRRGTWPKIPVGCDGASDTVSVGETGTAVASTRLVSLSGAVIGTRVNEVDVTVGASSVGVAPVAATEGSVVEVTVMPAGSIDGAATVAGAPNRAAAPRPTRSSAAANPVNARGSFAGCVVMVFSCGWSQPRCAAFT
jgi:hypothetical protein